MSNIPEKPDPADQAKTKAQLLAELNEARRCIVQLEATADPLNPAEERYRSVVTAMTEGVVMHQRSGEIVACNPAAEQILGLTHAQMMGRTSMDPRWRAIHEDGSTFPGETHPAMVTLRAGQPQRNVVMGVHKPDGTLVWILINSEPMFQPESSEPYAVVTTFSDITAQRQTEESLRQSEEKYRLISETSSDYLYSGRIFPDGRVETDWIFGASQAITGYSAAEVEALPYGFASLINEEDRAAMLVQLPRLVAGEPIILEFRITTKSGEERWLCLQARSLQDETIAPIIRHLGAIQDITERKRTEQRLQESEAKFAAAFQNSPLSLGIAGYGGKFVEVNRSYCQLVGLSYEEIIGRTIYELGILSEEEHRRVRSALLNSGGQVYNLELQIRSHTGERRDILYSVTPLIINGVSHHLGAAIDITERKRVEQALAASEHKLRRVIAESPDAIVLADETGRIIEFNPAAERLIGRKRAEQLGQMVWDMQVQALPPERQTPEVYEQFKSLLQNFFQTGDHPWLNRINDVEIQPPDGSHRMIQTADFSIETERGYMLGSIIRDITERKRAEEKLRESEERLRTVVENSRDGINLLDLRTGKYIFMSPSQVAMTGFTAEEMNNFPVEEAYARVHPDDRSISIAQQQQVAAEQTPPFMVEYRWKVKSGEYRWFNDSRGVIRDSQGNPIALVGISRDVTERKQAEEQLHIALEKYRVLFETFPLGISITDEKGNLIEANRESERLLGLLRKDHLQRTFDGPEWDIVRPDGTLMPPDEFASVQALKEKRLVENVEMGIVKDGGKITWLSVTAAPIPLEGYGVAVAYGDITERKRAEAAQRESEARFKTVFQANPLGISITRLKDNQLLEVNEAWLTISGFSREEAIGRTTMELKQWVKSDDREQLLRQLGQQGVVTWFEVQIRHKSGRVMELLTSAEIIEIAGEPCLLALNQDITAHKQMERIEAAQLAVSQILVESSQPEAALRQILESIATRLEWDLAKLWWLDSSGSRLVWQEGWRTSDQPELVKLDQLSRDYTFEPGEDLAGTVWQTGRAVWDQELRLTKLAAEARALGLHSATGIPIIKDEVTVGVMTFFSHSARPLEERLLIMLTDLGRQIGQFLARKEAEASLHRYEQMVSISPDLLSLVDRNYVYQIINQTYLTSTNKSYDQIVGHSVAEFFGDAAFATVMKLRLDRGLTGEMIQYQDWIEFPILGRRFMDVTHAPYREKDGTVAGVLVSGRDMTEAKLLEERLSQTQKMEMVGQLAAGMAHHYNNMLTSIIGFTSLSLHTLPPGNPVARNLEQVLNTAERMAVLVRQLLAFAQKQLLQFKTAPLNDLVRQLQGQLKQITPAPIEFALHLAPEVGEVKIDPRQFEHLLLALVGNAVDAMPGGGQLTLTTTNVNLGPVEADWYDLPPGDYVLLTVKDTGIGLSDEVKAHLYEPFFTTKEVGQGTGLGLAMSLGIARQHGGHLLAEGEPGQGATFMLYLPCLTPPAPPLPPVRSAPAQTILLIEAEPMVREFVTEVLSDQGYTVLKAANAEVAQQLMAGRPEVSLQLLLTPAHPNSPALIEQLKPNSPDLKVIFFIDELADLSFELKGTKADFLLKPFAPSSLIQKVKTVLEAEVS